MKQTVKEMTNHLKKNTDDGRQKQKGSTDLPSAIWASTCLLPSLMSVEGMEIALAQICVSKLICFLRFGSP